MPGVPASESHRSAVRSLPGGGHAVTGALTGSVAGSATSTATNAATSAVTVTTLPAAALIGYREQLVAVAAQAFSAPPWSEKPIDAVRLVDHMWCALGRPGFAAVVALDGPHLVGFAYGHTDTRCAALDPRTDGGYEAFELIELAISPAYQGGGIGRALHDALLAGAPGPRLLLTHPDAPARKRYLAWGWEDLGEIPGDAQPRVLMTL